MYNSVIDIKKIQIDHTSRCNLACPQCARIYKNKINPSMPISDLTIKDYINKSTINKAKAYFHLHFLVKEPLVNGNIVKLESSGLSIEFERASNVYTESYELSLGFNKTTLAYRIVVVFDQILETKISI